MDKLILQQAGGSQVPGGKYTFPGVDISQFKGVKPPTQESEKEKRKPEMNITYIKTSGELSLLFNQEMVHPENISQDFYNKVFNCRFVSSNDSDI